MAAILKIVIRIPLGILGGFLQDRLTKTKSLLHYWVNLLHYREVLHYWLIFITLSGSITLSGVYCIIGAKYYNCHISRYSSNFYGGHFKNSYPNPTGHIKWIFARKIDLKKRLIHYWLYLLHYREVLHYWLTLLHYREVLNYRELITLLK